MKQLNTVSETTPIFWGDNWAVRATVEFGLVGYAQPRIFAPKEWRIEAVRPSVVNAPLRVAGFRPKTVQRLAGQQIADCLARAGRTAPGGIVAVSAVTSLIQHVHASLGAEEIPFDDVHRNLPFPALVGYLYLWLASKGANERCAAFWADASRELADGNVWTLKGNPDLSLHIGETADDTRQLIFRPLLGTVPSGKCHAIGWTIGWRLRDDRSAALDPLANHILAGEASGTIIGVARVMEHATKQFQENEGPRFTAYRPRDIRF